MVGSACTTVQVSACVKLGSALCGGDREEVTGVCVTALLPLGTRGSPGLQADLGQKRSLLAPNPSATGPFPLTRGKLIVWMMERAFPPGPHTAKVLLLIWDWGPPPRPLRPKTRENELPEQTQLHAGSRPTLHQVSSTRQIQRLGGFHVQLCLG